MNIWYSREDAAPPKNRPLILLCYEWSDMGYQVGMWNGKEFYFPEQPNDMFDDCVTHWSLFDEFE